MTKKKEKGKVKKPLIIQKPPYKRAFIEVLPKIYTSMQYTPEELWKKFLDYLERSAKNGEEITISGFSVFSQMDQNILDKIENVQSQEKSGIYKKIRDVFENRYEQKIAGNPKAIAYLMNNRFKGKRENLQKNENNVKVNKDISQIINEIMDEGSN